MHLLKSEYYKVKRIYHCIYLTHCVASPVFVPRRVVKVVSVSASLAVSRGFAPRSAHTKDHHKWYKLPTC